jgi:hypothetical protein
MTLNQPISPIRQQLIRPKVMRMQYVFLLITIVLTISATTIIQFFLNTNVRNYRTLYEDGVPTQMMMTLQFNNTHPLDESVIISVPHTSITIDMISIGSLSREEFQFAQERTFATHSSVRNFYRINELNDTDTSCSSDLTKPQLNSIIKFCNTRWDKDLSVIRTWLRNRLKPFRYEKISTGWLCAQKRPIDALQLLLNQYRYADLETIPDYLMIIDDDTYINMDTFLPALQQQLHQPNDQNQTEQFSQRLQILGGCIFNHPRGLQFYYPHGGYGSIFSKATIRNLLRPIHCPNTNNKNKNDDDETNSNSQVNVDGFTKMACWRLQQDHFHELQYFQNGMSVSDLMYNYSTSLSFLNVDEWNDGNGFCFHSDHAFGYFSGFYHLTIPDEILFDAELSDTVRQEYHYGYSEIDSKSQCSNSYYDHCHRSDMICHYIQPDQMEQMYDDDLYYEDEIKANLLKFNKNVTSIDIISIGSLLKPHLHEAQQRTFGSHPSIRHWFPITELNDTDSTCSSKLTLDQVNTIYSTCKNVNDVSSEVAELVRRRLFNPKNHTGWMCAQKRPIDGLYWTIQQYKLNSSTNKLSLPNYLVIIDDDTYMNLNYLMEALPSLYPSNESHAITGCRIIHPKRIQFTFPFGGFGTILTRRAIENLIRPLYCDGDSTGTDINDANFINDVFNTMACWRLHENNFGEQAFFKDGMSVLDLMYAYSSGLPFTGVDEWNDGTSFCFHSDHVLGYFISFYHITVPNEEWTSIERSIANSSKKKKKVKVSNFFNDELRKSYTYVTLQRADGAGGSCSYRGRKCSVTAPFCHYVDANQMEQLYKTQMAIE